MRERTSEECVAAAKLAQTRGTSCDRCVRTAFYPCPRWMQSSQGSPRAGGPRTLIAGQPGNRFTLQVDFHGGARHLPIVSLKRAA